LFLKQSSNLESYWGRDSALRLWSDNVEVKTVWL